MTQNNVKANKSTEVEQLRKKFDIVASQPPAFYIFSGADREDFEAWSDLFRSYENQLRDMGEVF
jgi:hypothetical protein